MYMAYVGHSFAIRYVLLGHSFAIRYVLLAFVGWTLCMRPFMTKMTMDAQHPFRLRWAFVLYVMGLLRNFERI